MASDVGAPLAGLRQRAARKTPVTKRRTARVRRSVSLPPEVDEQLQEVLEEIRKHVDPACSLHAMMVAILDQASTLILDGDIALNVTTIEESKTRLFLG